MAEKQKELKTSATKQGEVLTAQFEYSARKHFQRRLSYENPCQRDVHDWGKYDTVYRVWYCLSVSLSDVSVKLAPTTKLTRRWAKRLATQLVNGLLTPIVSPKRRGGR